jgi:hypothetical protein
MLRDLRGGLRVLGAHSGVLAGGGLLAALRDDAVAGRSRSLRLAHERALDTARKRSACASKTPERYRDVAFARNATTPLPI